MKSEKASARPEMNRPSAEQARIDPGVDVDQPHGAPAAALVLERIAHWFLLLARLVDGSARESGASSVKNTHVGEVKEGPARPGQWRFRPEARAAAGVSPYRRRKAR